jgi:hypothetical protein
MKYKNMSLKNAFDSVSARRPCVRPNPGFWRQLMDYEKRLVNQQLNKNETSIPITIVSSANAKITSPPSSTNHPVKSGVTYNSGGNSCNHGSSINLAGSSGNPYQDYETRPFTASRYGSSSYLYGGERGSPTISKLYKSISGHPTSTGHRYSTDHYDNAMNHSMSSSAVSATVNPTSQHRTSLIINDVNSSRYTIKPVNFSTTYRSSYGRM